MGIIPIDWSKIASLFAKNCGMKQNILYYTGTKCDLRSVKEFDCVKDSEAVKLVKNLKLKGYVECAAKTNIQVKEVCRFWTYDATELLVMQFP